MANKFDHFQKALGLEDVDCLQASSPFDFERQGRLLVHNELGDPNQPQFANKLVDEIWPLVQENSGRCFVLCTSLRQVEDIAKRFRSKTQKQNDQAEPTAWGEGTLIFDLLVQGSIPRHELLDRFKKARAPILVGSASFWEGVDVPGQQLSMVVIAKLPFAPKPKVWRRKVMKFTAKR